MPFLESRRSKILAALFVLLIIAIPLLASTSDDLLKLIKNDMPNITPPAGTFHLQCPSAPEFCKEGKDIIQDGNYLGFGANLASSSAILASFDGHLTSSTITIKNERLIVYFLDNNKKDLRAVYYFKGDSSASRKVIKNEVIGAVKDKISIYNTSLIFQLIKGDPINGEKVKLTSKDFITH